MRRVEVSLLPWFSKKQGWNSAFASTTMGTGYSGLKTEFSLAWHPQAISVLAFRMHKQRSDFAGQMRSFSLWLLVKQPYLDFFQASGNKYNSEKSLGLAKVEFDFVPWMSDILDKPLLQITLHFLLWLKRRCERTYELTHGCLLAECLPKCVEELQINSGKVPSLLAFWFPSKIFPAGTFKINQGCLFHSALSFCPAILASCVSYAHHRTGAVPILTGLSRTSTC